MIAITAFYVVPLIPIIVLTSAPGFFGDPDDQRVLWGPFLFFLLWLLSIAPFCSAYFAAKLAGHQPLMHGLIVGLIGGVFVLFVIRGDWVFRILPAAIVVISGLFGGWLYRYRARSRSMSL